MSRKRKRTRYKNRTPAPAPAPQQGSPLTKPQAVAQILSALDGYSNAAAFLGEDSPLLASGTFRRSGLTSNTELLTVTYRENWLAKRIIDMPSEDMTRAWYTLATALPENALHDIHALEAEHSVQQELTNAIRYARLYGGSIALIVIRGEEEILDQPLDTDSLLPGCFQGLLVIDRSQGIEPSLELVSDLDDPDFGLPMYYTVNLEWRVESEEWRANGSAAIQYQQVKIHHSRVLRFIGRELPYLETVAENYWGASELEHLWDELQKRSATSANIAQLIFQANITTLKMGDLGTHLAFGDDDMRNTLMQALQNENRLRTSYGLQLMSANEFPRDPRLYLLRPLRHLRGLHDGHGRRRGDPRDEALRPQPPGYELHRRGRSPELLRHDRPAAAASPAPGPGAAPADPRHFLLGLCPGGHGDRLQSRHDHQRHRARRADGEAHRRRLQRL